MIGPAQAGDKIRLITPGVPAVETVWKDRDVDDKDKRLEESGVGAGRAGGAFGVAFGVERARRGPIGGSATAPAMGRVRIALIALATGAMFGLSTYLYVLSAEKAGPVS